MSKVTRTSATMSDYYGDTSSNVKATRYTADHTEPEKYSTEKLYTADTEYAQMEIDLYTNSYQCQLQDIINK